MGSPAQSERPAERGVVAPSGRGSISVCLLTFNHVHALPVALDSIRAQSRADCEIVVSDDRSSDGTWELILEYAQRDSRIKAIRTPTNVGMARNANFAVERASGEYIALLHHDDRYRGDLLERWADLLDWDAEIGFVFNSYQSGGEILADPSLRPGRMEGQWFLRHRLLWKWGCPVRGTAMVRRSCWDQLGGMRTEFGLLADVDLWMRLARRWPVGYVNEPLIEVGHVPPPDYPAEYTRFSWSRLRCGYEIHAANVRELYASQPAKEMVAYWAMRCLISYDVIKWLIYTRLRRPEALPDAHESSTIHELAPVNWLRRVLGVGWAAG